MRGHNLDMKPNTPRFPPNGSSIERPEQKRNKVPVKQTSAHYRAQTSTRQASTRQAPGKRQASSPRGKFRIGSTVQVAALFAQVLIQLHLGCRISIRGFHDGVARLGSDAYCVVECGSALPSTHLVQKRRIDQVYKRLRNVLCTRASVHHPAYCNTESFVANAVVVSVNVPRFLLLATRRRLSGRKPRRGPGAAAQRKYLFIAWLVGVRLLAKQ